MRISALEIHKVRIHSQRKKTLQKNMSCCCWMMMNYVDTMKQKELELSV